MNIPQISGWSYNARRNLGTQYMQQITAAIDGRERLMREIYDRALSNYECKTTVRSWPWKHASSARIPITPTHSDAILARLYNTSTGQDPKYLIEPWGTGPLTGEISVEEFARHMQSFSKFLENEEIPIDDLMELALTIMVKYGDCIIYMPWEKEEGVWHELAENGEEFEEVRGTRLNKPVPYAIHPKDFIIPVFETGLDAIQNAKWCGYRYDLDLPLLEKYAASGFYDSETSDKLRRWLAGETDDDKEEKKEDRTYFRNAGDGSFQNPDEFQRRREEFAGLTRSESPGTLEMYHIFAREDLDKDGVEEEIEFHVHRWSNCVPRLTYPTYKHHRRPFVKLSYTPRDGVFYSIGVPEMLFTIQDVLDQTIRDILDNNKIQNTKAFLVRIGSGIEEGFRAYPGRMIFVNSVETDFKPIDMGSGRANTSVGDIAMMQQWGERRTGISDFNLGQEKTGRTPATTTLALLEEANKRIDLVVRRMRKSMEEMWNQVLQLYMQYGTSDVARAIEGVEGGKILEQVWATLDIATIRKRMVVRSRASTQNLNRSVKRQEAIALFGQVQQAYETINQFATLLSQTTDPSFRELYMSFLRGTNMVMEKALDTFDIKDQSQINPDFTEMLNDAIGGAPITEETGESGRGDQVSTAMSAFSKQGSAAGPINPPGRPVPGGTRLPGETEPGSSEFKFGVGT
jgi:hypothetical protein